jgi:choline dehydrogenase-like flavoprotein
MDILSTSPLAEEIDGEVAPLNSKALDKNSSDEEIDQRVKATMGTVCHPMGTCALGTVLESDFRVKGVRGLRVCDASVFPRASGSDAELCSVCFWGDVRGYGCRESLKASRRSGGWRRLFGKKME